MFSLYQIDCNYKAWQDLIKLTINTGAAMFIETVVCLDELPKLQRQIDAMRTALIAMVQCVEYARASGIRVTRNRVINQAAYDIYRAVELYTTCAQRIIAMCNQACFRSQVGTLLEQEHAVQYCDSDEWCDSIRFVQYRVHLGKNPLSITNTGVRYARRLVFDVQNMLNDFDPDDIDWNLDTIRRQIQSLEQKFEFLREFFYALMPGVQ